MEQMTAPDTELVAALNDLLQLDRDAHAAYTIALEVLNNDGYKEAVRRFRTDHERHIQDLTHLVHIYHGEASENGNSPAGTFRLSIEGVSAARGDVGLLLAFKANERLCRDKYAKAAAQSFPADVATVLRRGVDDESRHYAWATSVLEKMGVDETSTVDSVRRALKTRKGVATLVGSALAVIGAGAVAAYLMKRR